MIRSRRREWSDLAFSFAVMVVWLVGVVVTLVGIIANRVL